LFAAVFLAYERAGVKRTVIDNLSGFLKFIKKRVVQDSIFWCGLFFSVLILCVEIKVVIEIAGDSVLVVLIALELIAAQGHPHLGQSVLTGDPFAEGEEGEVLGAVNGYPDVEDLQAVDHHDAADDGVETEIITIGPGFIIGGGHGDVFKGINLKNHIGEDDGQKENKEQPFGLEEHAVPGFEFGTDIDLFFS
jgi:hypothetical protein